jgi:hypothetical protein
MKISDEISRGKRAIGSQVANGIEVASSVTSASFESPKDLFLNIYSC